MHVCVCAFVCACVHVWRERELYIWRERFILGHWLTRLWELASLESVGQTGGPETQEELMLRHESEGCLPLRAPVYLEALV